MTEPERPPPRLVDLSHVIADGLVTYPGLPTPRVVTHLSREGSEGRYAPGTRFAITGVEMVGNTGTYLDAPFHRFAEGKDLAELPLDALANLPAVKVSPSGRAIGAEAFEQLDLRGKAVLVETGWSRRFGTEDYLDDYPYLTEPAAALLVERGVLLVGIDGPNVDDVRDGRRPVHTGLLAADVLVVEHLRGLAELPPSGFRLFAVPPRIAGLTSFPVRVFALIENR
jgi:kynurenine formamidase